MSKSVFSQWNRLLGIDLGSAVVRIWSSDEPETIITQPSCIAIDSRTSKVLAVGSEAQAMEGRVSSYIHVVYPVRRGVIYDLDAANALLKALMRQAFPQKFALVSPSAMIVVPAKATEVEKNTFAQAAESLGVKEVLTIAQPLAASIGAGVPIADSSGSFVIQLGAGIVETAIISLGSIVNYQSSEFGGNKIIDKLIHLLKHEAFLEVSREVAQDILIKTASLHELSNRKQLVAGQHVQSGSPAELEVQSAFLYETVKQVAFQYQVMIQRLLSSVPPELTVDIIDKGLLLSGGLAQLHGLDDYLVSTLGIPVSVVDDSSTTAIKGVTTALQHLELFKESLGYLR